MPENGEMTSLQNVNRSLRTIRIDPFQDDILHTIMRTMSKVYANVVVSGFVYFNGSI